MSINVYELVTNRIIEQLENNIVPWRSRGVARWMAHLTE